MESPVVQEHTPQLLITTCMISKILILVIILLFSKDISLVAAKADPALPHFLYGHSMVR